jgi:hypothetical protein
VFEVEDLFHGGGVDEINQCCCNSLQYVAKVSFSEDWGVRNCGVNASIL